MIISLSRMIFAKESRSKIDIAKDFVVKDNIAKRKSNIAKVSLAKDWFYHKKDIIVTIDAFKIVVIEITLVASSTSLVITTMTTNATTIIFLNQSTLCFVEVFRKARFAIFEFEVKWKALENSSSIIRSRRQFRNMWTTFLFSFRTTMLLMLEFIKWA